ncbi:SHOCT domain-containing protein [Halopiger thermotolerans]
MALSRQEFVADDLWLLIAIVTFALVSLVGAAGFEALAAAITIVGWFLLTPIFLFWGDEIADWTLTDREPAAAERGRDGDAIEELKRRYAEGKIDDAEFERRLERLVAVDDALEGVFDHGGTGRSGGESGIGRPDRRRSDDEPSSETEETYDRA